MRMNSLGRILSVTSSGTALALVFCAGAAGVGDASTVLPISQLRDLNTFAIADLAEGEDPSDVDSIRHLEIGPFDDGIVSSISVDGTIAQGEANQASDIQPDHVFASGDFVAVSQVAPGDPFAQALGASRLIYAFEVTEPTTYEFQASLSASESGSGNLVFRDDANGFLILESIQNESIEVDQAGVLEPGTYELTIMVSGYSTALPEGAVAASGRFTMDLQFGSVATAPEQDLQDRLAGPHVFPNPVSTVATIWLDGPIPYDQELRIYDVHGRIVRNLGPIKGSTATWNRRDDEGTSVPAGTYYVRAGDAPATKLLAIAP